MVVIYLFFFASYDPSHPRPLSSIRPLAAIKHAFSMNVQRQGLPSESCFYDEPKKGGGAVFSPEGTEAS